MVIIVGLIMRMCKAPLSFTTSAKEEANGENSTITTQAENPSPSPLAVADHYYYNDIHTKKYEHYQR